VIERGSIYWADLGAARGSSPAKRRPVVVIQADGFNATKLATTIVAIITSNTALATMPGNVFLPAATSGLPRDSAVNVTALATVDRRDLADFAAQLPERLLAEVDRGLRLVLGV
jgi:mRNA interferase MazF